MTKYHYNSLLSGIVTAQLISFLHVFQSNSQCSIGYAFAGSMFISLTAGVSVSTLSVCLIFICVRLFNLIFLYLSFWLIIALLLILIGEGPFTLAYTIVIPFVVLSVFNYLSISQNIQPKLIIHNIKSNNKFSIIMVMIITILITVMFFYFNCDGDVFLRARDYLILASKQGEFINDFYYKYTPYAVEAIKPTSYKMMRFLSLIGLTVILPIILCITIFLLNLCSINFIIKRVTIYKNKAITIKTITISAIIAGMINILIALFIFYSLYPLYTITKPILRIKPLSISNFITKTIPAHKIPPTTQTIITTKAMFDYKDYRVRVEGLRELCKDKNRDNIWKYPDFIKKAINGNIVEKYWLANAFGSTKSLEALPYLEKLLHDPSINVQCATIQAIGSILTVISPVKIHNNKIDKSRYLYIIQLLEKKIDKSNVLYVQQRACNTLNIIKKRYK